MDNPVYLKLFYKNFMAHQPNQCHVGLGVGAMHVGKVLRAQGIKVDLHGIWKLADIHKVMSESKTPVTHAIVEAPFLTAQEFLTLMRAYPDTIFICRYHSQVGFLQVDPGAVRLIREYMYLQEQNFNFRLSVNSHRLGHFMQQAYHSHVLLLPNLYPTDRVNRKPWRPPGPLVRIGSFGALRIQKNHTTAAAAAMIVAKSHGWDLEFHVNSNRDQHTGILGVLRDMFKGVPNARLVEVDWKQWAEFRHYIRVLDLHIQLSATETFNLTSADATAEGVPIIVGEAIDWAPKISHAHIDDAYAVASKAHMLLHDPHAAERGLRALERYVANSIVIWKDYLSGREHTMPNHLDPADL